jgi:uncharacterized membrane protein
MSRVTQKIVATLPLLLVVSYMVTTHIAVVLRADRLALAALGLLLILALLRPLRRGAAWAYAVVVAAGLLVLAFGNAPWARIVLFLPPVLVNAGFALVFGHTLAGGSQPLVQRFIDALHGEAVTDGEIMRYARRVTVLWTVIFCVNASVCLLLALLATPGGLFSMAGIVSPLQVPAWVWSVYSDIGCYAIAGLTFLVEYEIRRVLFPSQPYRNFLDFMRRAMIVGPVVIGAVFQPATGSRTKTK